MPATRKSVRKPGSRTRKARSPGKARDDGKRWSRHVMETSNALDLEAGVFTKRSPKEIAQSLKRSAQASQRRKSDPYRSAMSMLTFHINRAGKQLSPERKRILNAAKGELRKAFHRDSSRHAH